MKTLQTFLFAFCLLVLSISVHAQNQLGYDARVTPGNVQAVLNDTACKANFSVLPDSLTSYPYYYHFKDLSTGDINTWLWEFGDGNTSTVQNPLHQYDNPGTYHICLTVGNTNTPGGCADQYCQDITTLSYFSLGGLVYAGDYPLNNPVNAGDTGVASLYRIVSDQVIFVQDNYFQAYGYYWFGFLFPGNYLVKVGLTEGSPHFKDYFTTYHGNQVSWNKAQILGIDATSLYDEDIHLTPVVAMPGGQGIIRGYVKFEQNGVLSIPPISMTSVILLDKDNQPLEFTRPNSSGFFEFTGLPFDTYYLIGDATGKPSTILTVALSEDSPLVEGLNLTIFGSNANYIPDVPDQGMTFVKIYPNPVKNELNVRFFSQVKSPIEISIQDVSGRELFHQEQKLETGINQLTIPVATLPAGIFILSVKPLGGNYVPLTAKFIK